MPVSVLTESEAFAWEGGGSPSDICVLDEGKTVEKEGKKKRGIVSRTKEVT
ncbi:hypothetical protein DSOL_1602 [Desulfosporosinus metallidurans]|uniref:Uncharacterized protein n=1 Tax=Desulfosporosinus metallidurans TaxID=1888891 RepID=A0A1Q8QYZ5_9FIRM|nr:hypothetical protein DSOL_1602 [Desulfosporosinus metallidurans]